MIILKNNMIKIMILTLFIIIICCSIGLCQNVYDTNVNKTIDSSTTFNVCSKKSEFDSLINIIKILEKTIERRERMLETCKDYLLKNKCIEYVPIQKSFEYTSD